MIENVVQRNVSKGERGVQLLLVAASVFLGTVGILTIVMLPAFFAALAATVYYSRRLKDEFDYCYDKCNDILTIDRIIGGRKRKSCLYISTEQIYKICPYADSSVVRDRNAKLEDYASRNPNARVYVITIKQESGFRNIIFEPQDDLLEVLRLQAPEKVEIGKVGVI